jgi:hypothetical protein
MSALIHAGGVGAFLVAVCVAGALAHHTLSATGATTRRRAVAAAVSIGSAVLVVVLVVARFALLTRAGA